MPPAPTPIAPPSGFGVRQCCAAFGSGEKRPADLIAPGLAFTFYCQLHLFYYCRRRKNKGPGPMVTTVGLLPPPGRFAQPLGFDTLPLVCKTNPAPVHV